MVFRRVRFSIAIGVAGVVVAGVVIGGRLPVPLLVLEVLQHIVQLLGDQVRLLEGLATLAMEQRHEGRFADVFHIDDGATLVGSDGAGGLVHHDIAA